MTGDGVRRPFELCLCCTSGNTCSGKTCSRGGTWQRDPIAERGSGGLRRVTVAPNTNWLLDLKRIVCQRNIQTKQNLASLLPRRPDLAPCPDTCLPAQIPVCLPRYLSVCPDTCLPPSSGHTALLHFLSHFQRHRVHLLRPHFIYRLRDVALPAPPLTQPAPASPPRERLISQVTSRSSDVVHRNRPSIHLTLY